ncbi:12023_t:CDS:2 [Gigaspora margarita]|uniref:12023_t:CDS:1 n=1 Tax=Gigaspora margarita TaxID=4874 RepID=A0ABN7UAV5_GIGMA|nr:12023_t:CDS:2 [Gigaspora margarita]
MANLPTIQTIREQHTTDNHNPIKYNRLLAITEPTWQREDRNSQIDDIWITASLHHNLNLQALRAKKNRWKVYLYSKMDQAKWKEFTKEVKNRINKLNIEPDTPITEIKGLDKTWHNLSLAIKQAAT